MDRHVPSSGDAVAYGALMSACNAASCAALGAYAAGSLGAGAELKLELVVAALKAAGELAHGRLTADLIVHHAAFAAALGLTLGVDAFAPQRPLLVAMNAIHVPLLFANLKLMLSKGRGSAAREALHIAYLTTWAPAAVGRSCALLWALASAVTAEDWRLAQILATFSIAVVLLDALWTPWKAYAERPRACFVAALVGPQLWLWSHDGVAASGLSQLHSWALVTWEYWPTFSTSAPWLAAVLSLSLERLTYTTVWVFPAFFTRFCRLFKANNAVDVVVVFFMVNKVLQFLAFVGWWVHTSGTPLLELVQSGIPAMLESCTLFQLVAGLQMILLGQWLNGAIYKAIGKDGVYYGVRLGRPVSWYEGFPFNVVAHPQYTGAVMTAWGLAILLATPHHVRAGWFGIAAAQTAYYIYMALVESHAPQIG